MCVCGFIDAGRNTKSILMKYIIIYLESRKSVPCTAAVQ